MKAEKYQVTTYFPTFKRTQIWDATQPMAVDYRFQWLLEQADGSVYLRNCGVADDPETAKRSSARSAAEASLPRTFKLDCHDHQEAIWQHPFSDLKIGVRRLSAISPAYLELHDAPDLSGVRDLALFAFSGSGRSLTDSVQVQNEFVAYTRKNPVFILQKSAEHYSVQVLLPGVHLKLRHQKSLLGNVGDTWKLTPHELTHCTVARANRWWRFKLLKNADLAQLPLLGLTRSEDLEERQRKRLIALLLALGLFLSFGVKVLFFPWTPAAEPKVEVEKPEKVLAVTLKPLKPLTRKEPKRIVPVPVPEPTKPPEPKPKKIEPPKPVEPKPEPQFEAKTKAAPTPVTKTEPKKTPELKRKPEAPVANKKPEPAAPTKKAEASRKPETRKTAPGKFEAKLSTSSKQAQRKATTEAKTGPSKASGASRQSPEEAAKQKSSETLRKMRAMLGNTKSFGETSSSSAPVISDSGAPDIRSRAGENLGTTQVGPSYHGYATAGSKIKVGDQVGGVGYGEGSGNKISAAGGGSGFVEVAGSEVEVDQGLSQSEVGKVIHAHRTEIRFCQDRAMASTPDASGKLLAHFSINPQGRVESARVESSTLNNSDLEQCILGKLKELQFPRPKGGVHVAVTYPFVFKVLRRD